MNHKVKLNIFNNTLNKRGCTKLPTHFCHLKIQETCDQEQGPYPTTLAP